MRPCISGGLPEGKPEKQKGRTPEGPEVTRRDPGRAPAAPRRDAARAARAQRGCRLARTYGIRSAGRLREIATGWALHRRRELLEYTLSGVGAVVRCVPNAGEVLAVLSSWTPDVLLLDSSLPDVHGVELLARASVALAPA
jgi:hypothetical protein